MPVESKNQRPDALAVYFGLLLYSEVRFLISEEMPGFDGKEVFEHYTTSQSFVIILGAKLKWASVSVIFRLYSFEIFCLFLYNLLI